MRKSISGSLAVVCVVLSITVAYLIEERRFYHALAKERSSASYNYSGMLATCLNGKPLYDKLSGQALFTEKAIAVDLTPIRKKNAR